MKKRDLEIPLGKRTRKYRFLEILPGVISYGGVVLLFLLSYFSPILGAIYLLFIISMTLVKAIGVAYRSYGGFRAIEAAERVDWEGRCRDLEQPHEAYERLRSETRGSGVRRDEASGNRAILAKTLHGCEKKVENEEEYNYFEHLLNLKKIAADGEAKYKYVKPSEVVQAVIMVAYNEGLETMRPSIQAVVDTEFPNERIVFVLGYEERGGAEIEKNAKILKKEFKGVFREFLIVKHPDGVKGEIAGKGPNLCCAAEELEKYLARRKIRPERVMVTSIDSDNRMHKKYLSSLCYEYCAREQEVAQRRAYQPVCLFMNNLWDAAAPMRVIAVSNSFYNMIQTMRPHALWNFASHSQPFRALSEMGFWSKRTIVEDGHQYFRSYFYFKGRYDVVPIRVPIYQDAVVDETIPATLKAQFVQLRRWAYGASDVAYVGNLLFSKEREVPFLKTLAKFMRLLDSHITRTMIAPIVAFGGWVPMVMNLSARGMTVFNLPLVVSVVQTCASIGLLVTVIVSVAMLPERPKRYGKFKVVGMVGQWIFAPIVALVYSSASAYVAQTKLLLGCYMEKFDVTKKVVKS